MASEHSILGLVGIDEDSERIYRFVLREGAGSAVSVAHATNLAEDECARRLDGLRAAGLLARQAGGDGEYTPVDPRFSLRLLTDRHSDELARIRAQVPDLAAQFDRGRSGIDAAPQTRLLGDPAEIAGWFVRIQHQAGHEFMAFDRPPYISAASNPLEPVVLDRGVDWRAVYSAESFESDDAWQEVSVLAARGEQARVIADLPIKLAIADRSVALISLTLENGTSDSLVTESPPLVRVLCELFESYWERAIPIPSDRSALDSVPPSGAVRSRPHRQATADERAMLVLIGAGLTDEAIARQLGISSRTLRRRTQDLMVELRASNRFQVGAEAARRGWV